jgi:hypothetical protein
MYYVLRARGILLMRLSHKYFRLADVTEFVAERCGALSMETAWLLLQGLTKIGNINIWPSIVKRESVTF